jgi:hypothetical protein
MDKLDHRASPAEIVTRDVESVLNMLDLRSRGLRPLEQDDVEPAGAVGPMMLREKLRCQSNEFDLFLPVDGFDRSPKIHRPSRLDLHEYQDRTVLSDKVQLAQRRPEIFGNDAITFTTQITLSRSLSFLPEEPSGVKNCHAMVRPESYDESVALCGSPDCPITSATGA